MHFTINIQYTEFAQRDSDDIAAVYTDSANEYIVEKYVINSHGAFNCRLAIKRVDQAPIRSWRALQDIKNSIVGTDSVAIEIYPRESDVTDTANIYHLWVFKEGLSPNVSLVGPKS